MKKVPASPRHAAILDMLSRILAAIVIGIGALTALGWLIGIDTIMPLLPDDAAMKMNTALVFVLAGIALLNLTRRPRITQILGMLIIIVGIATVAEYAAGLDLGIDQLLVADPASQFIPGRMSPVTAVNFVFIGIALIIFASPRQKLKLVGYTFTLWILLISTIVLLGYVFAAQELHAIYMFSTVSVSTGVAFIFLVIGILLATANDSILSILSYDSTGGYIIRRLLPIVLCLPILIGWLSWRGVLAGLYSPEFSLTLITLVSIISVTVINLHLGCSIHLIDVERSEILAALRRSQAELESKVDLRTADLLHANQILEQEAQQRKQAEMALREKEEQLQTVFDLLPAGASIIDPERRIVRVNLALERILDLRMADMLAGKHNNRRYLNRDGSSVAPDEFPSVRALKQQHPVTDQVIGVCKEDGTIIWTSVSAAPLPRNQGVIVVTADISERLQSELALRESEERFRASFEYAGIGMAWVSPTGGWIRVNQAICDMLGYTAEELLALSFQDITHPEDLDIDLAYVQQMLNDEIQTYHMEKRYLHRNGHIVWAILSVALVRDDQNAPLYFISQIQNISDLKVAEAALRNRLTEEQLFQSRLKALHEISLELMATEDLDTFYRRAIELGISRLGYERLGLLLYDSKRNRAMGTYGTDAHGNVVPEHHLDFQPGNLTSILLRALQDRERFVVDENAQLYSNLEPIGTGTNAVAVLWNGVENVGWLAADNGIAHTPLDSGMLDILSLYSLTLGTLLVQKTTLNALQASEARFRSAITHAPFPVMIHAEDGEVLNISEVWSAITGYAPAEIPTIAAWTEKAYGMSADKARAIIRATYHRDSAFEGGEFSVRTKSGDERIWDFIAAPLGVMPDGRRMVSSMAMDVTERKQAERDLRNLNTQLQQANQEVQQFAYIVSHDLRSPLINLKGFSEILRTSVAQLEALTPTIQPVLDEQQAKQWQDITQSKIAMSVRFITSAVDRLDQFTSAILKLSRLGHRAMSIEQINTKHMVQNVVQSLLPQADPDKIEVTLGHLPDVAADRVALDQIFGNIINNAVKYLDPSRPGKIQIWGEQVDQTTTFHIQDNGRGIDEIQREKVFAPFRRGISDVEGEGMGLAYVQALVKRHNGNISFESTPGVGTTFSFTISIGNESTSGSAQTIDNLSHRG